jgi:pimeloyl-ACP methyl ester carboxylesterase
MNTETRDILVGDGTVRTRVVGSGPPIVFVHGALVDGRLWDGVVARLAGSFTCVVPDLPLGSHLLPLPVGADPTPAGHARRVAALLEALDLRDVTLVGNDSGGVLCQLVAAHHPERLGRLVLTNCDALEVFPPAAYAYFGWLARSDLAMAAVVRLLNAVPVLARLPNAYGWLARSRIDGELLRAWLRPSLDAGVRRDVAGFFLAARPEITLAAAEALRGFRGPVLLAWGERDPFFRIGLAERLLTYLRDGRIVRFDAACYVALDQPAALADQISTFARERRAA